MAPVSDEDILDAEETPALVRPTTMPASDTPVNRHIHQVIWKTRTEGIYKSEHSRYGRQRLMEKILRRVDEAVCHVYMGYLQVFSGTNGQHVEHLRCVFKSMRKIGLKSSTGKSALGQKQINFLGHTISKNGVRPDR